MSATRTLPEGSSRIELMRVNDSLLSASGLASATRCCALTGAAKAATVATTRSEDRKRLSPTGHFLVEGRGDSCIRDARAGGSVAVRAAVLVEFDPAAGILEADPARDDLRAGVVLAPDRRAGQPPQHGELPGVGERVRHRALKQLLRWTTERRIRGEEVVEAPERGEESLDLTVPGQRLRGIPHLLPLGHVKRPVEQVADVGHDLGRRAGSGARAEGVEPGRRSGERLRRAIAERRHGVTEEVARGRHSVAGRSGQTGSGLTGGGWSGPSRSGSIAANMKFSGAIGEPARRRSRASWPAWVIASASGP